MAQGVVYDTLTRLSWAQDPSSSNSTILGLMSYCSTLSLAGGGWRMPTIYELASIIDLTRAAPAADPTFFPNNWLYLTSSTIVAYASDSVPKYYATKSDGSIGAVSADALGNYGGTRCVR
jgi:hypothetical protein